MKGEVVQSKMNIFGHQWGTFSGIENSRLAMSRASLGVQLGHGIVRRYTPVRVD